MEVEETWVMVRQPVWVHKNQQFIKGVIKEVYKDIITVMLQSGDSIKLKRHDIYHRNPMPFQISRTDLMENDIINQPEILQHLSLRFLSRQIYTFVQNTLIAVNPYTPIPQLTTDQQKDQYINNFMQTPTHIKDHPPHLYGMTAQMVKSLFEDHKSQAIIISGESGAGKTQANKECLRFLAQYFKKINTFQSHESNIQRAIMLSNPILEAFGNAKTIRNNNSSRFGKYLSIMIDSHSRVIKHAQMYNYLLEKSRIISRSKEEQNFHVFYEFLIKTTKNQKMKYDLIDPSNKQLTFQDFVYTKNQTQTEYHAHPDVSFEKIKQSLTILPDPRSFDYLCRILSAVLHLGNLEPYEDQNLDYCQIMPSETLQTVCQLLQINQKLLFESLTSYSIRIGGVGGVGGQDLVKSFSKRQVQQLIHSLSKTLYQKLFQWIINQINSSTRSNDPQEKQLLALGFLDIYGFQVLKSNSLQQLFINYTNQRLHQLYLHKIFKLEKEHFVVEKLEHKFRQVNFQDNIKVIQLIDYDQLSIFNLLDEWCTVASPDQTTFITKLRFNHKKHQKFPPANLNLLSTQFMIKHTPQQIQYNVAGFRQKNKDLLREQIKITMRSSKLKALQAMFTQPKVQAELDSKAHKVRKFLSSKFRKQMNQLVQGLLSKSELHFIRCIKSNGNKKPLQIEQQIVYSQIKYLGILDTIKIKKMGYCIKIKYQDLDKKYPWLVRKNILIPAANSQVSSIIKNFLPKFGEEEILYGANRIFFKDYAYTVLMKKYLKYMQILNQKAHKITSFFVKINYIKKKQRKLYNKKIVVKYVKSYLQAKRMNKRLNNIRQLQKRIRDYLSYKRNAKKFDSIQVIQAYIKRNIQTKLKLKRLNLIQKVILRFKFFLLRKKVRSRLIANFIVQKIIINKVWGDMREKHAKTISKYVNSLKVKIQRRDKITEALVNERNAIQGKSLFSIQYYLLGFANHLNIIAKRNQIKSIQSNVRTYVIRKSYQKLRNKIILVQKAIKQYLFMKKGAKKMFQSTYKQYQQHLNTHNKNCQLKLYDSDTNYADQINVCIKKFLGKFKQKISLIYFIIDFESFIDLDLVYPNQSWTRNYTEVFREGLQKNDPIQYISVGETFTVVSSTTKMYLWGMHDSYRNLDEQAISQITTKMPVQHFQIHKNKLNFSYVKDDQNQRRNQMRNLKISSTIAKDFNLENGKVYECFPNQLSLIRGIPLNERILQISCGKSHTIMRSTAKKVYTFGYGRQGQLGHSNFNSEERPKSIKFFEGIKTSYPIQVSASFTSSLVLLSNRKLYWFGKNGNLSQVSTPTLFQLKSKSQAFNGSQFSICRIVSTWSRTMSITGVTVICFNGKFQNNLSLRNKTIDILFSKWQQVGINNINPPFVASISDHFQQCHVKLKSKKINIYPESKATLKQMQEKVKSISSLLPPPLDSSMTNRNSIGTQFSFANTQRNSMFK